MTTNLHFELPKALVLNARTIVATGLVDDGLPVILILGDGLFTARDVA